MRTSIFLPKQRARRLDGGMAEFGSRQARRGLADARRSRYTPEQIADGLMSRRDRLVDQVPLELAAARGLTRDQWEFAVDGAIDYVVTEYGPPIRDPDALQAVFWKATSLRILQLREGREATIRGGWRRVDLEKADLPSLESDPQEVVIRRSEQALLLEFAATLSDAERQVLVCQYGGRKRKTGRVTLARQLGMAIGEVRK